MIIKKMITDKTITNVQNTANEASKVTVFTTYSMEETVCGAFNVVLLY